MHYIIVINVLWKNLMLWPCLGLSWRQAHCGGIMFADAHSCDICSAYTQTRFPEADLARGHGDAASTTWLAASPCFEEGQKGK